MPKSLKHVRRHAASVYNMIFLWTQLARVLIPLQDSISIQSKVTKIVNGQSDETLGVDVFTIQKCPTIAQSHADCVILSTHPLPLRPQWLQLKLSSKQMDLLVWTAIRDFSLGHRSKRKKNVWLSWKEVICAKTGVDMRMLQKIVLKHVVNAKMTDRKSSVLIPRGDLS